ncbi:MAG: hypothetical protein K2J63_11260 [Muribaculaceae bacterium]|nr:hypothetical protein [Muribaculaceae bacterium]
MEIGNKRLENRGAKVADMEKKNGFSGKEAGGRRLNFLLLLWNFVRGDKMFIIKVIWGCGKVG